MGALVVMLLELELLELGVALLELDVVLELEGAGVEVLGLEALLVAETKAAELSAGVLPQAASTVAPVSAVAAKVARRAATEDRAVRKVTDSPGSNWPGRYWDGTGVHADCGPRTATR